MARINLRQRIREIWQKLSQLDARPDQIAAGFSIGIAASFVPLNPSPIIVATVAAWLLKRNVIAAVAGAATAILYIPLLPLIWLAEYRLGKLILPVQHPLTLAFYHSVACTATHIAGDADGNLHRNLIAESFEKWAIPPRICPEHEAFGT